MMNGCVSCRLLKSMAVFHGYSVVRPIAKGGEGEVWLVRHALLQTDFAVKVIPKSILDNDAELLSQFSAEARIAGKVRHPSLVSVYDAGLDERTGLYFLVMDFMPGGSVAKRLSVLRKFSVGKAASIVRMIALGLVELKRLGIVHRDVKPQNMLVAANGDVRLADFGISLFVNSSRAAARSDVAIGTPLYMSYEQIADSNSVDSRADVYSLGVSFFEMLAGTCPDSELSTDELLRVRLEGKRLPDIRTLNAAIPEDVACLIYRMTDPDVVHRISGPEAVVAEIDAILDKDKKQPGAPVGKRLGVLTIAAVACSLVLLCVMLAKGPSKGGATRESDLRREEPRPSVGGLEYVPDRQGDELEQRTDVVTQVVESVREVVKLVVVTAAEDSVQTEIAPRRDAVQTAAEEVHPAPKTPVPEVAFSNNVLSVCGMRLEGGPDMTNEIERLSRCIAFADAEVRKFIYFGSAGRVQSSIDEIRIVKSCKGATGWKRNGKSLEVGLDVVSDDERLEDFVSKLMTSHRDRRAIEPFEAEMYKYIRYRVWDGVAVARGRVFSGGVSKSKIKRAIDFCRAVKREHGRNDYNGQLVRYGARNQVVPYAKISRNREGKVFLMLSMAEELDASAILHYFKEKDRAIAQHTLPGGAVSASDFAALMSNAVGYDLFPMLAGEGWSVDKFATNVKVRRLPEATFFGER